MPQATMIPSSTSQQASEPRFSSQRETAGQRPGWVFGTHSIAVSCATDAARAAASIVLTTPGLSVIIDAIKESRKIFQRMNSYAIYRIAETLRVLLFVTLVILIFDFFPVTAVMIVMLALLNDGAILSIAYDNVHYSDQPESWNMRLVLGIATVLGVIGPSPHLRSSTSATASST